MIKNLTDVILYKLFNYIIKKLSANCFINYILNHFNDFMKTYKFFNIEY
jgi:hypothetical protein